MAITEEDYIEIIKRYAEALGVDVPDNFNVNTWLDEVLAKRIDISEEDINKLKVHLNNTRTNQGLANFEEVLQSITGQLPEIVSEATGATTGESSTESSSEVNYGGLDAQAQEEILTSFTNANIRLGYTEEQAAAMASQQLYEYITNNLSGGGVYKPKYEENEAGELVPVVKDGVAQVELWQGHWQGTHVSEILNDLASPDEIWQLQQALIATGAFEPGYFAGVEGKGGSKTQQAITAVMAWIDQELHATEGTPLYNIIMSENPVYFTKTQEASKDWSYHRNLFSYGLNEMLRRSASIEEVEEAALAKTMISQFIPPSEFMIGEMIQEYARGRIGRELTESELATEADKFADAHSPAYAQAVAAQKAIGDLEFLTGPAGVSTVAGQEYDVERTTRDLSKIDLSAFSTQTPQEIYQEQFDEGYEKEMSVHEKGKQIQAHQRQLMEAMFNA